MWKAETFPLVQAHVHRLFDEISTRNNIYLSAEAKDVLAKEIILRGNYHRKRLEELDVLFPKEEASQLCEILSRKKRRGEVGPKVVASVLVKSKTEMIVPVLESLIDKKTEVADLELGAGVKQLLTEDLSTWATKMAESGLLVDEIVYMNDLYIDAVMGMAAGKLNKRGYIKIKSMAIFDPIVRLTITSEPSGAEVSVGARSIGNTTIEKKPFEAQRTYKFIFNSPGYKTSERLYYVVPYPTEQNLNQVLLR